MEKIDHDLFQARIKKRWDKLAKTKFDFTDANSIKEEIAKAYGYEREKADYEYEQFMNELAGREERAEITEEKLGDNQARASLAETLKDS